MPNNDSRIGSLNDNDFLGHEDCLVKRLNQCEAPNHRALCMPYLTLLVDLHQKNFRQSHICELLHCVEDDTRNEASSVRVRHENSTLCEQEAHY